MQSKNRRNYTAPLCPKPENLYQKHPNIPSVVIEDELKASMDSKRGESARDSYFADSYFAI
jgi:hypothetical protein